MFSNKCFCLLQCFAFVMLCVQGQRGRQEDLQSEPSSAPHAAAAGPASAFNAYLAGYTSGAVQEIALGVEQFGFDLLQRLSEATQGSSRDIMVSPFSIWSIMVLLLEGAAGRTYAELRKTLRITVDDSNLRTVYRDWFALGNINSTAIEIGRLQALFTDSALPVSNDYTDVIQNYNARLYPVNFRDPNTVYYINGETSKATQGLIEHTVSPQDIVGAKMFMLSTLFFKGLWKYPFDSALTQREPFYDEAGNVVGQVQMMTQENQFGYATIISGLDGYVLEMPYGNDNRFSMIIVLPKRQFTLHHVVKNVQQLGLSPILQKLAENRHNMPEELVEVSLPKFDTKTDFNLNPILQAMGITELFNANAADLSKMAQGLFVHLVVHSTKVVVDEKGTTAAAATAAILVNKTLPPKFKLNKPFLYMIVDKSTQLLLFTGLVRNPKVQA